MKKVISIALSLVLAVSLLSLPSASAAALANAKITDELSAAITKDGSAKAFVTMNDVDHAKVMKTFMTEYPAEFEAYTQAKFDVAASSGIEITDELVQSAVERKRKAGIPANTELSLAQRISTCCDRLYVQCEELH